MKSVIFDENQLGDLQEIGEALFRDETDPRSTGYIRKLNRPAVNWWKVAAFVLLPLVAAGALGAGLYGLGTTVAVWVLVPLAFLVGYLVVFARRAAICGIRIYQRYAPGAIRNKCRFEPSCSEYAVMAIEKYGLIRGLRKAVNRLKWCNINGGGVDYP